MSEEYTKSRTEGGEIILNRTDTLELKKDYVLERLEDDLVSCNDLIAHSQAQAIEIQAKITAIKAIK